MYNNQIKSTGNPNQDQKTQNKLKEGDEFKVCIVARSKYGKTVLELEYVQNLIDQGQIDPARIVMFSKDALSDKSQIPFINKMKQTKKNFDKANVSENINMDFINDLFKSQKKIKESGKPYPQWLLIFDDQISDDLLHDPELDDIFTRGRKYGLNMIWLLQYFKKNLDPKKREQFTDILLGSMNNLAVLEDVLMQFSNGAGQNKREALQNMIKFYNMAIQSRDGHGFLHIRTEIPFGQGRLQQNFDDFFFDVQNGYANQLGGLQI